MKITVCRPNTDDPSALRVFVDGSSVALLRGPMSFLAAGLLIMHLRDEEDDSPIRVVFDAISEDES